MIKKQKNPGLADGGSFNTIFVADLGKIYSTADENFSDFFFENLPHVMTSRLWGASIRPVVKGGVFHYGRSSRGGSLYVVQI